MILILLKLKDENKHKILIPILLPASKLIIILPIHLLISENNSIEVCLNKKVYISYIEFH